MTGKMRDRDNSGLVVLSQDVPQLVRHAVNTHSTWYSSRLGWSTLLAK